MPVSMTMLEMTKAPEKAARLTATRTRLPPG